MQLLCKILTPSSLLLLDNPLFLELRYAAQRDRRVPTLPQKTTWDSEVVLDFIKKLPASEEISKVDLSARCLVLLLLVSGRWKIDLHRLDVRLNFMRKTDDCYYLAMSEFAKGHQHRNDHHFMQFIEFAKFPQDPRVCTYTIIEKYLYLVRNQCPHDLPTHTQFFVHTTDGGPAHPDTLARWGCTLLEAAGIKRTTLSSTRSAHSSKAFFSGEPLDSIMNRCAWTKESTFFKSYCKPLTSTPDNAAKIRSFTNKARSYFITKAYKNKSTTKALLSRKKQLSAVDKLIPHKRTVDSIPRVSDSMDFHSLQCELQFNEQILKGTYNLDDENSDSVSTDAASDHLSAESDMDMCKPKKKTSHTEQQNQQNIFMHIRPPNRHCFRRGTRH